MQIKTLRSFCTKYIMRDQTSIEYEIAQRQIEMRDMAQKSMFTHIQWLLDLSGLPSVFELMCNTPPKLALIE